MTSTADLPRRPRRDKPGRRSRIHDQDLLNTVLAAVERGVSVEAAAALAGIGSRTLYDWRQRGEDEQRRRDDPTLTPHARQKAGHPRWEDEEPYLQFSRALTRARGVVEERVVTSILETIRGGFVTKRVSRTLRDGSQEAEETFAAPDGKLGLAYLERTRRGSYARQPETVRAEVTGPGGASLPVQDEAIRRLAANVREALARQRESTQPRPLGPGEVEGEVVAPPPAEAT